MRTRRLLLALLVAVGLTAAACSDSDNDPSISSGDGDATTTTAGEVEGAPISFVPLDPGAVTFEALENGDVDMALLFSTQGVIAEKGWAVLEDDMTLQGSDNLIPLVQRLVDEVVQRVVRRRTGGHRPLRSPGCTAAARGTPAGRPSSARR